MYKKEVFENGLRLITVPMQEANSITVLVLVGTGSKHETKPENGISHFLEHMFFKGTKRRPNTLMIAETLDRIGGEYNAFTSKEMTGFWAKVDKKHIDVALDWISDMFLNSKFEEKEIDREKGVIVEELNMYLDTPTVHVTELWEELLYKNQPAGWRIVGEKENILGFSREMILNYYKNHYSTKNTVVSIAGGIENGVEKKIQDYFKNMKKGQAKPKLAVEEKQKEPEILVYNKKTDQTHFCLGVRAYDLFNQNRYPLAVLSTILGGNMSSRLFISVRERNGLAYSVHSSADYSTDTGYFVTQAGIDHKNLEKSVGLILKEYAEIKAKKVPEEELKKAKDYLKGTMALSLDSSDSQASYYAVQEVLQGEIITPEQKMEKIDAVIAEDVQKVAQEIFVPEKLNLAILGPVGKAREKEIKNLLKI